MAVQRLHQHHLLVAADRGADGGRVPGQHAGGEASRHGPGDAVVAAVPDVQGRQQERGVLPPAIQPQPLLPSGLKVKSLSQTQIAEQRHSVAYLLFHSFISTCSCCRLFWGGSVSILTAQSTKCGRLPFFIYFFTCSVQNKYTFQFGESTKF